MARRGTEPWQRNAGAFLHQGCPRPENFFGSGFGLNVFIRVHLWLMIRVVSALTPPEGAAIIPAMKILLTGATGFIGRRVARLLAARGFELRCLVRPGSDQIGRAHV